MEVYLIIVCVHIAIRKYAKLDAVEKTPTIFIIIVH